MRWIMSLVLCALGTVNLCYAEETPEQSLEQVLEPLLEQLRADDLPRVLSEIAILGIDTPPPDRVEEMLLKRKKFRQMAGKPLGEVELIDVTRLGSRIARLTYIEHSERYMMVWRFTMYRGSKQWRMINFNSNDELGDLFEKTKELSANPGNLKR
jgi:hypothetical protein